MASLVTLAEVKERLAIMFSAQDGKIEGLINEAEDIIIGYIEKPDHGWTSSTVPGRIKSAIILVVARLYANDDQPVITDAVKGILRRDRKPVVA